LTRLVNTIQTHRVLCDV